MSHRENTTGLRHPAVESGAGSLLEEKHLSDRGRVSVILQAAALLSHLESAGRLLDSAWSDLRVDKEGVLRGAQVAQDRDPLPAQSRLCQLVKVLFGGPDRLVGKGQAKLSVARMYERWRRFQGTLPADRMVTEILDEADFLWQPRFAAGRRGLVAELSSVDGSRALVAGRGSFAVALLVAGATRESLASTVSDKGAREIWEHSRRRSLGMVAASSDLAKAKRLCFRGLWQEALEILSGRPGISAGRIQMDCLRRLGRLESARRLFERCVVGRSAIRKAPVELLDVAGDVYLDLGQDSKAKSLLETQKGSVSSRRQKIVSLLTAETAARLGDWQAADRSLGSVGGLEHDPFWLWRLERLAMGRARSLGKPRAAEKHARKAILGSRRRIPRIEAALLWRDLASIRLEQTNMSGALRAGRHALRLFESVDDEAAAGMSRWLMDLHLRQGHWRELEVLSALATAETCPSRDPDIPGARELQVRLELVRGRPAEALIRAKAALADDGESDPAVRRRLHVLTARALGWLGRGAEARELLDDVPGPQRGILEPEEYPALWALAGDWQRAREIANGDKSGRIWRQLLGGDSVDRACWEALEDLEPYRMARLVFDVQILCPGSVPAGWLDRAVCILRQVEAHSFAERLDRSREGSWRALESFLAASSSGSRDVGVLFTDAGYFDARLEWRDRERTEILVAGNGGADNLRAAKKGGELVLSTDSMDVVIRTLFALAVRDFEPEVGGHGHNSSRVRGILGDSSVLREALGRLERLAVSDIPVLVQGESGTGKELAARQLHHLSGRSSQPLVPVNCAALSESLLLSDLFGHVRGAFTGADRDRAGVFESARGGTVMLDEIGDLPLVAQGKLLRVLQEGEVRRVGESTPRRIDIRVVAATHRNLERMVEQKSFRQDLYYRLKVGSLTLPPLRERGRDVLLLADHFVSRSGYRLTQRARRGLLDHRWPGNVRELRNVLQVAMALCHDVVIDLRDLELPATETTKAFGYHQQVEQFRRGLVSEALAASEGHRAAAARRLGVSRQAMSYLVRRFGLQ